MSPTTITTATASPRQSASLSSTLVSSHSSLASSSSSGSSSHSHPDNSDSDGSDDDDDDDDADTEATQRLKELFLKAKQSARLRALQASAPATATTAIEQSGDDLANNNEVVMFGEDDEDEEEQDSATTPKAGTSASGIPHMPSSLVRPVRLRGPTAAALQLDPKGKGKAGPITLGQDLAGVVEAEAGTGGKGDKWGKAPVPTLSKKERKGKNAHTAGPKWFNMPAPELTPELKREIHAMRLRNALDPKRFYKGGAKDDKKMPEFFSVGHLLPSARAASNATPSIARKRTFVEELVDDEQARAYTKRKTAEVMAKGMSGRKGGKKRR